MLEENCHSGALPSNVPVVPLPVALYVSEGLIFELYDGGQPHRQFVIRWERLRPTVPVTEENT
jgi:hypothetical protein